MGLIPDGPTLVGGVPGGVHPVPPQIQLGGVFKGGGSLGAAYPGMLRALWWRNMWFKRVAGTSGGSIVASLIAAGFSANEIEYLSAPVERHVPRPGLKYSTASSKAMTCRNAQTANSTPSTSRSVPTRIRSRASHCASFSLL